MSQSVDSRLMESMIESLRSSDVEAMIGTCNFLETVVVHDFSAFAFLQHKELFTCILKLCCNDDASCATAAINCTAAISNQLCVEIEKRKTPSNVTVNQLLSQDLSARDRGDGVEKSSLSLSCLAVMIAESCHQMILSSKKQFHEILNLLAASLNIAVSAEVALPENIEFCQTLASISVATRAASRQNFTTILLLIIKAIQQCPKSALSPDIVYEIYNGMLDTSIIHYHPEILPSCLAVLEHNPVLYEKYLKASCLFLAFRNLAKFLKSSTQDYDLAPVISLLKLDEKLAESLLPSVFKYLKEYGGKPATTMTLLLLSQQEPILGQVYEHLSEIASPVKSHTIGPHIAEMLVDEGVVFAIKDGMLSKSENIPQLAEKILTLILKGKPWMNGDQWKILIELIAPKLILSIESELHRLKMLGPVVWDLMNQALVLPPLDDDSCPMDASSVLKFLIRNMSKGSNQRDKACLSVISALCQQRDIHLLRPRLSAIDSISLLDAFRVDSNVVFTSTTKFDAATILETVSALKEAELLEARSLLVKLSIVIEDTILHSDFLNNEGLSLLTDWLHKSLLTSAENEPSILSSVVKCLLYIAHFNPEEKNLLSQDINVTLNVIRAMIISKDDVNCRRNARALLELLSKEEATNFPTPFVEDSSNAPEWSALWRKALIRWSAKFVFNAELSTPPLAQKVPSFLRFTAQELEVGAVANDLALTEKALALVSNAKGHEDVEEGLFLLREIIQRPNLNPEVFDLGWQEGLEAFFNVLPESTKDENIFALILDTIMIAVSQLKLFDDAPDYNLYQWLHSLITDSTQAIWKLFNQRCQDYNKADTYDHLLPSLLRFVSSTVLLIAVYSQPVSLHHIVQILSSTLDQDSQAEVYQLSSLKLLLDCLVNSTVAAYELDPSSVDQAMIAGLLKNTTATTLSFSSKSYKNKGRSIIQSCSKLINLLVALSKKSCYGTALPSQEWLMTLLRHPDPVVKSIGLHVCTHVSEKVHINDDVAEIALSILFNLDETCFVFEQACLLVSQHAGRMNESAVHHLVKVASTPRIQLNQTLVSAICLLLTNCLNKQDSLGHSTIILNGFVPVIPSYLSSKDADTETKANMFTLLIRVALLQPALTQWLITDTSCVSAAIVSLFATEEKLVSEAALLLCYLLHAERQRSSNVLDALLLVTPDLWGVLTFLSERTFDSAPSRIAMAFVESLLVNALSAEKASSLNLDAKHVECFTKFVLDNSPVKAECSLRCKALEALGLLFFCSPDLTEDTVKLALGFISKELKLVSLKTSEKYLLSLIRLVHNFVLPHKKVHSGFLQRGCLVYIIEQWKIRSSRDTETPLLLAIIDLQKALASDEKAKEVQQLLKLMIEFLEEKESLVARQTTPIANNDWILIKTLHELLLVSAPALEFRREIAKYKFLNDFAVTWHPIYLKRIMNRQQNATWSTLRGLRMRLLAGFTIFTEPVLPELLETKAVETIVDVGSYCSNPDDNVLVILRNISYHSAYRGTLIKASNVIPFLVRVISSDSSCVKQACHELALATLITLCCESPKLRQETRSSTEGWLRRHKFDQSKVSQEYSDLYCKFKNLMES